MERFPNPVEKEGPGKYEGETSAGRWAHGAALDGSDETIYDGERPYDLVILSDEDIAAADAQEEWKGTRAVIVTENDAGFVYCDWFDSVDAARAAMRRMERDIEAERAADCS